MFLNLRRNVSSADSQHSSEPETKGQPPPVPLRRRHGLRRPRSEIFTSTQTEKIGFSDGLSTSHKNNGDKGLDLDGRCVSMPSVVLTPPPTPLTPPSPSFRRAGSTQNLRFHRRFPAIASEEGLVNYYSCALVADILLQGILYISENHFAFYSNIFGYKRKIIIPVVDVVKVTKERTAKIIPNAIGVCTVDDKYVFASMLSRDTTYHLMQQIWAKGIDVDIIIQEDSESDVIVPLLQNISDEDDSASGCSEHGPLPLKNATTNKIYSAPKPIYHSTTEVNPTGQDGNRLFWPLSHLCQWTPAKDCITKLEDAFLGLYKLPRTSLLLLISTFLLVLLFTSASILMYRIALVHRKIAIPDPMFPDLKQRLNTYHDLHTKQHKILNDEVARITESLKTHVQHLNQMRLPLEELARHAENLPNFCRPPEKSVPSTGKYNRNHWYSFVAS